MLRLTMHRLSSLGLLLVLLVNGGSGNDRFGCMMTSLLFPQNYLGRMFVLFVVGPLFLMFYPKTCTALATVVLLLIRRRTPLCVEVSFKRARLALSISTRVGLGRLSGGRTCKPVSSLGQLRSSFKLRARIRRRRPILVLTVVSVRLCMACVLRILWTKVFLIMLIWCLLPSNLNRIKCTTSSSRPLEYCRLSQERVRL